MLLLSEHRNINLLRRPSDVFSCTQDLRGKLLSEAEHSAAANAEVAVRWGSVLQLNVSQDMFRAIEEQRIACEAIIASKDRLIAGEHLLMCG